ncbi:MAG: peptidylprolyl isomerase [Acidobacteriota bacterium]|nr:peptidylprolyl isomerase [Acidobacteriota bacterium]
MKRTLIGLALAAAGATTLFAQQAATAPPAPAAAAGDKVVATVNGENITRSQLDHLWYRMSEKGRAQYEKSGGGKRGFLENYILKRLMLQQAAASGFTKSPEVQAELEAAKEAALFDLYVRDVVAAPVVNENVMRQFYNDHAGEFQHGERAKVRLIFVAGNSEASRTKIAAAMQELVSARATNDPQKLLAAFASAARKYSEHATASSGGDLGWVEQDEIEAEIAGAAFALKPGTFSGIIEGSDGLHLVYSEGRQPASKQTYEDARAGIREYLLGSNTQKIIESVNQTTAELKKNAKVTVFIDNVD